MSRANSSRPSPLRIIPGSLFVLASFLSVPVVFLLLQIGAFFCRRGGASIFSFISDFAASVVPCVGHISVSRYLYSDLSGMIMCLKIYMSSR
jgi:hypothetical protein